MEEELLSTVVAALVTGASFVAKEVASKAVSDAYHSLKEGIIHKLGRQGAVQSVEDNPESEAAQTVLIEALAGKNLEPDDTLGTLAGKVLQRIDADASTHRGLDSSIEIDRVRGHVGAIVEHLRATGRIRIGEVIADQGTARISDLHAGTDVFAQLRRPSGKPGGPEKN
jgi:hypothetical protein